MPMSEPREHFVHEVCPACGHASVPYDKVLDQQLRGCPKCAHEWWEDLQEPRPTAAELRAARGLGPRPQPGE